MEELNKTASQQVDFLEQSLFDYLKKETDEIKENGKKFNKLKLYFGDDYEINGITIKQPKMNDIIELGELGFYQALSPFIYNTTYMRVALWEMGIDWYFMKDIELFGILIQTLPPKSAEYLSSLFPTIPITKFQSFKLKYPNSDEELYSLYCKDNDMLIPEETFNTIAEFLRESTNFHPKVERPKSKAARKSIITEEKMNAMARKVQGKDNEDDSILCMISGCVNHPGFSSSIEEVRNMPVYQFMDSAKRLQVYESTHALNIGQFNGFCDTKKIGKEQFNFMRSI